MPQSRQKPRSTPGLDAKSAGWPEVKRNAAAGTVNQATSGAAAARRQSAQWQSVAWKGVPPAS